jgi:hypothetical protein
MLKTNSESAYATLRDIADNGYVLIEKLNTPSPRVFSVFSLEDPDLDPSKLRLDPTDPIVTKLSDVIGSISLNANVSDSAFAQQLNFSGNAIGVTGMILGNKIGIVVFRNDQSIPDTAIAETVAAMIDIASSSITKAPIQASTKISAYISKVIDGFDDQQIADDLSLSLRAVKERKKKAMEEFGATTLSQAVVMSMRQTQGAKPS